MKAPKLLPWYARKAGVTTERANVLWRKAVREATQQTGWVGNSEYFGAALDNFMRLLDEEKHTLCAPIGLTPLVRSQNRIWMLPLTAAEDLVCALSIHWHRILGAPRRAA